MKKIINIIDNFFSRLLKKRKKIKDKDRQSDDIYPLY